MTEVEQLEGFSTFNRSKRLMWNMTYVFLFRPFSTKFFRRWRNFLLRIFGARIHNKAGVYSSAKVWAPWNLVLEKNAWIGPDVNCYNVDIITLGENVTVSQGAHLCTASHNVFSVKHELITAPILLDSDSWVAANAYVHMGVIVGQGSVVGVNACVYRDVEPWTIVGGNPAKVLKKRVLLNG